MQKRPPLLPVPNELANYQSNANKLMQRVGAMPGLNKFGGWNLTSAPLARSHRQLRAAHPGTHVMRRSLCAKAPGGG